MLQKWTCLVAKCAFQPQNKSKTYCEDVGCTDMSRKATQRKRSHYYNIKETRLQFASVHRDKVINFCRYVLWSDETKIRLFGHYDYCYIWGKKAEAWEHHPNCEVRGWQHHAVGVFSCRRDWCTSQNRWHHQERSLCSIIEATSQDISQDVKSWVSQLDNDSKHIVSLITNWLKDNKIHVQWMSNVQSYRRLWAELKRRVRARQPINLTQLHQFCQEEWAKITANYHEKPVEGNPKICGPSHTV